MRNLWVCRSLSAGRDHGTTDMLLAMMNFITFPNSVSAGELPELSNRVGASSTPLQTTHPGCMPVGAPLDNTAVFIVPCHDEDTESAAARAPDGPHGPEIAQQGSVGEVCIAGACVAAGYLGHSLMAGRYQRASPAVTMCYCSPASPPACRYRWFFCTQRLESLSAPCAARHKQHTLHTLG